MDEWSLNSRINDGLYVFQVPMDAPNTLHYPSENPMLAIPYKLSPKVTQKYFLSPKIQLFKKRWKQT